MGTIYKQALKTNVPEKTSEFIRRFADNNIIKDDGSEWIRTNTIQPYGAEGKLINEDEFPQFNFNQTTVQDFFEHIAEKSADNMYKDMLERIGRVIIWADDLADNEFLRFMQPNLDYGAAIENGAFNDIKSRKWLKNYQALDDHSNPVPNPLFMTQYPEYVNSVAEVNFSREIPLKISEIEYKKCCQTAQTIGDVAAVLIGKINVTFIDDMYEACKQYFCGSLRIAPEETGTSMPLANLANNPMVEVIDYTGPSCPEDEILAAIHRITDADFYYKSHKFNPAYRYTRSKQMTLILPKKWQYPVFLQKWAATYHPEYIKLGEDVDLLYIDAMPAMATSMFPKEWEFFGILVDNRCMGITPLNGGFSVNTFFNPQDCSTSYFGHYEFIFSFLPFFNRKYIFLNKKTTSLKDGGKK